MMLLLLSQPVKRGKRLTEFKPNRRIHQNQPVLPRLSRKKCPHAIRHTDISSEEFSLKFCARTISSHRGHAAHIPCPIRSQYSFYRRKHVPVFYAVYK